MDRTQFVLISTPRYVMPDKPARVPAGKPQSVSNRSPHTDEYPRAHAQNPSFGMPLKPVEKKKQFSARPAHVRSVSYGRNMNKLARITSTDELQQRPKLNRSRSTDSNLTRRNKSFTRLASIPPRSEGPRKVVIDLNPDAGSSESEKEDKDEVDEEVDEFSDEGQEPGIIEEPVEQQILSYKPPPQFSHAHASAPDVVKGEPKKSLFDSEQLAQEQPAPPAQPATTTPATTTATTTSKITEKSPAKDPSQYYHNMILSQSTGAVRAFGDQPFQNSLVPDDIPGVAALQYIHSNDRISGVNVDLLSKSSNSLRQFTIAPLAKMGSSDETSSSVLLSNAGGRDLSGTPSNFSQFLKSSGSNIETRTQQKLWLQRENSLLDVSQLQNSPPVNPHVRREFERVSREFVNVRRFVNPLTDAVRRVNVGPVPVEKGGHAERVMSIKTDELQAKLVKLWILGERSLKRPQRPALIQTHSSSPVNGTARSPVAPTTRAVDRAQNADMNKRIDLAAMRMPDEVQKLA